MISGVSSAVAWLGNSFAKLFGMSTFENFYRQIRPYFIWLKEMVGQIADIIGKLFSHDFSGLAKAVSNFTIPSIDDIRRRQEESIIKKVGANQIDYMGGARQTDGNPWAANYATAVAGASGSESGSGSGSNGADAVNKVTGAAQPVRNQTINIDAFVKGGINTKHTNLQQMDERQLEAWFKNMFLRVMANMETSYQ